MSTYVQHRRFKPFLQPSRKIAMAVCDFLIASTPCSDLLLQKAPGRRVVVAFLASPVQTKCGNANRTIGAEFRRASKEVPVSRRIAIRGKPHDLVFIAVEIESEVQ